MIWLRPELFKFTDLQSLCRLSCTSKTLRSDLQGIKAWARLAEAQYPPPTPRDDSDARSHVKRRELAKATPPRRRVLEGLTLQAVTRETPAEVAFTPNELDDFAFFLRLTDDAGELVWEGDVGELRHHRHEEGLVLDLSMGQANFTWTQSDDEDHRSHLRIALVAIRDEDQAMVSLGHFDPYGGAFLHGGELHYDFHTSSSPSGPLFISGRSQLGFWASLYFAQEADVFRAERLELTLHHVVHPPLLTPIVGRYRFTDTSEYSYDCDESQFRHVLSYLAGVDPLARASALATIESWFVEAEREAGWPIQE